MNSPIKKFNSSRRSTDAEPTGQNSAVIRAYSPGDEVGICRVMAECHPGTWHEDSIPEWRWKYAARPASLEEDVLVAEAGGEIVACFHSTMRVLKLEEGLQIPVSYNGDWAVVKAFRGKNLTGPAWDLTSSMQRDRGALIRVGFATEEVNEKFYRKRFGSVFVPSSTVRLRRAISRAPLEGRVQELGEKVLAHPGIRCALRDRPWSVKFEMERMPAFSVHMKEDGFTLLGGDGRKPDLRVSGSFAPIAAIPDGPGAVVASVARELMFGRLRIRGLVRSSPRLIGCFITVVRRWRACSTPSEGGTMTDVQTLRKTIDEVTLELVTGDIAAQDGFDAVVNAANAELRTGGGVAGALHRAAGPGLEEECRSLAPIRPGEAVITSGHGLPNPWVIHCLGPVYGQDRPEDQLLASCYEEALRLCEEKELTSVAFPAISTGAFGYPLMGAARAGIGTVLEELPKLESVRRIRFVLFDDQALDAHVRVLEELSGPKG